MKSSFLLVSLIVVLSGCGPFLADDATEPTPTFVALTTPAPTVTRPPTATPIPLPSPTPVTPTVTPIVISSFISATVTPTATAVTPAAAVPVASTRDDPPPDTAFGTWAGTWNFNFGSMTLTQREAVVEGTYQLYGGPTGQITGVYVADLNQFKGLWVSDANRNDQGFVRWRFNPDGDSFSGTYENNSLRGQWCGIRVAHDDVALPAGCGFSGPWQLKFGSPPGVTGTATLAQVGPTVSGSYSRSDGGAGQIVAATLSYRSMTEAQVFGTWQSDRGTDTFDWRFDLTTGHTFQGFREPGTSEWCGWRPDVLEPRRCGWQEGSER